MNLILYVHSHFNSQFSNIIKFLNGKCDQVYACSIAPETLPDNVICTGKYVEGNFESNGNLMLRYLIANLVNKEIKPSLIVTHVGDGTGMFLKTIFPNVPTIGYIEWFYTENSSTNLIKNHQIEMEMENCSICISPTQNQKNQFPDHLKKKIMVIHEGIDTTIFAPVERIKNEIPIITYVSRGLEPMRGFYEFIDGICKVYESGTVIKVKIIGQDKYFYDDNPESLSPITVAKEKLGVYIKHVEFMGGVSRPKVKEILNLSDIHIYFTKNYALSWSFIEALAMGCIILGSDTLPLQEFINPFNGVLVDYTDSNKVAMAINQLLEVDGEKISDMKQEARNTALSYSTNNGNAKWSIVMTGFMI